MSRWEGQWVKWDGNFLRLCHVTRARLTKLKSKNKLKSSTLNWRQDLGDHEEQKKQWRNREEEGAASSANKIRAKSPPKINLVNKICCFRLLPNKMTLSTMKDSKLPASFQWIFSNKKPDLTGKSVHGLKCPFRCFFFFFKG